ncbi:MAG: ATP-binding cassette domain-containing protein [Muribaculaceae bacterium]|nr:ATP-binding cassette domain-containing protein [Alistipes senegalensis]MCM1474186.1 ATP-binding cassette domain-containing protein [Muribaculaceae bacterium]
MLQLKDIFKQYGNGENKVTALNGVNVTFRENEFVAILGHSGCGKTTILNIIGGLDHYTSGDLIINGVSTKKYKDRDWDAYRNHSIGFIFQSYNLIPHQTVLANVELALTISGVSKSERRRRAKEALEKVGLGNQLHKKPNQMSGGQMQRVAIARALINNPDILLADEPTGALDSETSIQVMELLKEIARDKLVIMVTHNPELAEEYATRIVRIKDGQLTDDSDPYTPEQAMEIKNSGKKRVSMSFGTAVSLSLNNLMTKKGRTLLTSFAGSIGIIGIATILSLSTGINDYINDVQEDTLSSYPLQITRETADTSAMMASMMEKSNGSQEKNIDNEKVYSNVDIYDIFNTMNSSARQTNNMKDFRKFIDENSTVKEKSTAIAYSYDVNMPIFTETPHGEIIKVDFMDMYSKALGINDSEYMSMAMNNPMTSMQTSMMGLDVMTELLASEDGTQVSELIKNQYDVVNGRWCENYDEVVVVLTPNNELPDIIAYAMGLKEPEEFSRILKSAMNGENIEDYGNLEWNFDEIINKKFKMILPYESYRKNEDGTGYTNLTETETGMDYLYNSGDVGTELKVVGFIKPNEDTDIGMISGYIAYTPMLTQHVIEQTNNSDIMKEQIDNPETDIITGSAFLTDDYKEPDDKEKISSAKDYIKNASDDKKAEIYKFVAALPNEEQMLKEVQENISKMSDKDKQTAVAEFFAEQMGVESSQIADYIKTMNEEEFNEALMGVMTAQYMMQSVAETEKKLSEYNNKQLAGELDKAKITDDAYVQIYENFTPAEISTSTYDDNLKLLGKADISDPSCISIYVKSFSDKDDIADVIKEYNNSVEEDDVIHYTDYVALLMSSVTSIISGISYLLIAFVGISLVVSSIMIGIITYISVLERTREIGILRAIGASKHDVSTVFNAETMIVGLTAGLIGIGVSVLLTIPINLIIHSLTSLDNLNAYVPAGAAVILVVISMALTLIAGVIPSRVASKKDPVEALRTE